MRVLDRHLQHLPPKGNKWDDERCWFLKCKTISRIPIYLLTSLELNVLASPHFPIPISLASHENDLCCLKNWETFGVVKLEFDCF